MKATRNRTRTVLTLAAVAMAIVGVAATSANAAIISGTPAQHYDSNTGTATNTISGFTVAAGTDRKLVLAASWESGNTSISATWNGTETFSTAVNSALGRNSAILYLDNPTPGTGNIVVTYGANARSRVGVVSLTGAADSFDVTSTAVGLSGSLTTTAPDTFVTGVYTSNGAGTITSPFSNSIHNGDSGSSHGQAGYQNEPTAGLKNYAWTDTGASANNNALAGFVPVNEAPAPTVGEISVIRSESLRIPGATTINTLSFDAGDTADKLVVQVSAEGGPVSSITYNGVALTQAIAPSGRNSGIYYLDDPFTGGSADLVVNFAANANGIGLGVVSITGSAPGVSATAFDLSNPSVMLDILADGSFVLAGYGAQGGGNAAFADSPLTQIYGGDIGSAKGAAGYENGVAIGLHNYSFSTGKDEGSHVTFAAAFAPTSAAIPEPATMCALGLAVAGLGGYVRKRRRC